jgi:hypothetical protein
MLTTHPATLLEYCRSRQVRYLVLTFPDSGLVAAADAIGIDPGWYKGGTRLARRTVWWRLYRNREAIPGLSLLRDGPIQIWKIN